MLMVSAHQPSRKLTNCLSEAEKLGRVVICGIRQEEVEGGEGSLEEGTDGVCFDDWSL